MDSWGYISFLNHVSVQYLFCIVSHDRGRIVLDIDWYDPQPLDRAFFQEEERMHEDTISYLVKLGHSTWWPPGK
jgi:hypothetical protein